LARIGQRRRERLDAERLTLADSGPEE
jgi:hypothetical protein